MNNLEIKQVQDLDELALNNLADKRDEWLKSANEIDLTKKTEIETYANYLMPEYINVVVKRILSESSEYNTLVLRSEDGSPLPFFKAGQSSAVTISIDGNKMTRSYPLSSNPEETKDGEWRITIKNNEEDYVSFYLFNNLKIGEKFQMSAPFGDFYYNPLRDAKNIISVCIDNGIIPIYSMVQAICNNVEDFNLTIFYLAKKENEFIFKEEINEYASKSNKIKINYILGDYNDSESNLINKINEAYINSETSIFISGNEQLLDFLNKRLSDLNLPKKYIRYYSFIPSNKVKKVSKYTLTIHINDEKYEIPCYNNKTIMQALEDSSIYIPSKCQVGICGLCRSELVFGEVRIVNDKRSKADKRYNYIHPCSTYPLSDIELIVR